MAENPNDPHSPFSHKPIQDSNERIGTQVHRSVNQVSGYNRRRMRFSVPVLAAVLAMVPQLLCAQTASKAKSSTVHRPVRPAEPALPPVPLPSEPGEYAVFYTTMGNIVCRLFDKDAPKTVANFVALAKGAKAWHNPATGKPMHTPLYSGTIFHRVIPGFMIQGGDPLGTGMGDPGYKFEDEFNSLHQFDKAGILAMANSGPNTNGSQFFITVAPTPHLNGRHTIFGEVVSGQDVADEISKVSRDPNDAPIVPVKLNRVLIRVVRPAAATPGMKATPTPQK